MTVSLIGAGANVRTLTTEAKEAIARADVVIGAKRILDAMNLHKEQRVFPLVHAEEIADCLANTDAEVAVILFSGDTGFYSGAVKLLPLLQERNLSCQILPGISSVQMLASRMRVPWQDWTLCSAHGEAPDPVSVLMQGKSAFFLTGTTHTPSTLCKRLADAGLGSLRAVVGECLYEKEERIADGDVQSFADKTFLPLSVLWVEQAPVWDGGCMLADRCFVRGKVPMTKQEVRAAILVHLGARETDVIWDVGAGTGSVSVALAHAAKQGHIYAVERKEEALSLIEENRKKLCAWNLSVIPGEAPEALRTLPAPDAVFVGGSGGLMKEVIAEVFAKNRHARFVASAITMDTLQKTCDALKEKELPFRVTQIAVSKTDGTGDTLLMKANNPVFLIGTVREEDA